MWPCPTTGHRATRGLEKAAVCTGDLERGRADGPQNKLKLQSWRCPHSSPQPLQQPTSPRPRGALSHHRLLYNLRKTPCCSCSSAFSTEQPWGAPGKSAMARCPNSPARPAVPSFLQPTFTPSSPGKHAACAPLGRQVSCSWLGLFYNGIFSIMWRGICPDPAPFSHLALPTWSPGGSR